MDWFAETLDEFGRQLGLPSLALNAQGVARLELASGLEVTVEPQIRHGQQEALVAMAWPSGDEVARHAQQALRLANAANFPPFPLQLAVAGHGADARLIAATRLAARAFTAQSLSTAIGTLRDWLESVAAAETARG